MASIKDLAGNSDGKPNPAGTTNKVYLVCVEDVATFPALSTGSNVGDSITYSDPIVLKTNKAFATIDVIVDEGELTHTAGGTRTAKAFENMFDFKLAKTLASDEWVNNHINSCIIALVKEKSGKIRLLGTLECPTELLAAEGKTGKGITTEKSWICQIKDTTGMVAAYYTGAIDLTV
jgi:hypothetical protein